MSSSFESNPQYIKMNQPFVPTQEAAPMNYLTGPTFKEAKKIKGSQGQEDLLDRPEVGDESSQKSEWNEVLTDQGDRLSIRLVRSTEEFAELETAWNRLAENPLSGFRWHFEWWTQFGDGSQLQIYCLENHGEVVGIAPFFQDRWLGQSRLRFVGSGKACTDYADLIVDRNYRQAFIAAIANETPHFAGVELIEFEGVDDRGPAESLAAEFSDKSWEYRKTVDACWYLTLPNSWEEFCKAARGSLRRKIRKAEKRLEAKEVVIRSTDDDLDFEIAFATLVKLHQVRFESKGEPGVFADPAFESFLKQSARELCSQQRAEIFIAYVDSKPIGAHFYLLADSGPQFYQGGVLTSRMDLEPGHLMFTYAIKKAIANGYREFDFLRGNEPYKPFWGAVRRELFMVRLVSKKLKPTLVNMAFRFARRSKHLLADAVSRLKAYKRRSAA